MVPVAEEAASPEGKTPIASYYETGFDRLALAQFACRCLAPPRNTRYCDIS